MSSARRALAALAAATAALVARGVARAEPTAAACLAELDHQGTSYRPVKKSGITIGVEIDGPLGGVTFAASSEQPLVIDCSLAVSLGEAGRYLAALGVERATYSSAFSKRNVRGTNRPSKHSYGLAIDVHTFTGPDIGTLVVDRDFEQGLGDTVDCIGEPLTQAGALLSIARCQLVHSGFFHLVLTPDYDDAHFNHFHLEALPWRERDTVRAATPAIH